MSSTNRGAERRTDDAYETPPWAVHRLLDTGIFDTEWDATWYEPACGSGAIIRAVNGWMARRAGVEPGVVVRPGLWYAQDIRPAAVTAVADVVDVAEEGDFLTSPMEFEPEVIITNPPYSLAEEFVQQSLKLCRGHVAMLLRLAWLSSEARAPFMRAQAPDVYVLPNRPSFTGGTTDSADYAWFVWPHTPYRKRERGIVQVLASTPREKRASRRQAA